MHYNLEFDIIRDGYSEWIFPIAGMIFIALGVILVKNWYRISLYKNMEPLFVRNSCYAILIFAVGWTILTGVATYGKFRYLKAAMVNGKCEYTEGVIDYFDPMPYEGHKNEKFCIKNSCFEYGDFSGTSAFHTTASHGGPIALGQKVKIASYKGEILRLEILE